LGDGSELDEPTIDEHVKLAGGMRDGTYAVEIQIDAKDEAAPVEAFMDIEGGTSDSAAGTTKDKLTLVAAR
jgi:hypothetical protein